MEEDCPSCHKRGCKECGGTGRFVIDKCPREFVGSAFNDLFRYAAMFERGLPPIAGGVLDQSPWFLEFADFWWGEQQRAGLNG